MKKFFSVLAICLLLPAFSCNSGAGQADGPDTPSDKPVVPGIDDTPSASNTSLLALLKDKIDAYKQDATVPTDHVFICAHRANTYESYLNSIPENSIPNIETAIAKGADMVELDVRPSKDGTLFLMHDESVNATTDGKGNIGNMTDEQIKALKMKARGASSYYYVDGEPVRVPTLEEALAVCKGRIYVNLDLANKNCSPSGVVRAIQNTGTVDQVMIYGANGTSEQKEYIQKGYERCGSWLAIHPYISSPDNIKNYTTGYYDCAKLFQYNYEVYYNNSIDRFGSRCHAAGGLSYSNCLVYDSQLRTWYGNYKKNIESSCTVLDRFIASGSDFLQTDHCEIADLYLKSKGLR